MSFWDVSFSPAPPQPANTPPQTEGQPSQSLNDEVTEVIGQLERFWGGFRKQGQSAIQAARKDLGDYVSQAQKGINQQLVNLSESVSSSAPTADADAQLPTPSSSRDLAESATTDGVSSGSSSTSASTATLPDLQRQEEAQAQSQSPTSQSTLFTRLQSSISPDLLTSLRDTIPDSVRDPQARMDLAHAAQARMQGAAARGEELLRGASVFLRDAVRVVPPDQTSATSTTASSSRPHSRSASASAAAAAVGEVKSSPAVQASSLTPATRRGALLRALRTNPAILRVDPAAEERSAVVFAAWVDDAGRDAVSDASRRSSELAADDGMLGSTLSALVPGELSEDVFWTRYFFRVHQINQEDEQRKAVLSAGPTDHDDDFSWEDEDEDAAPKSQLSPSLPAAPVLHRDVVRRNANVTAGSMSPQQSEDSFDIVSGPASTAGDASTAPVSVKAASDGDDDGGDNVEKQDEDEEESDWE